MRSDFFLPFLVIETKEFVNSNVIDAELGKIEIVRAGQPADWRFERATAPFAPVNDPFEHAHVFTETWPEEFSVCALAKPVHIKNQGRIGELFSDIEPVPEISPDVVSAERQHCHRIAPYSP